MEFTVYTRPGCPYCDKIKTVLEQRNLEYTEYVLDENFTREEFYEKFGVGSTFPQVIMDEQNLGGCSDTVKYLISNSLI
jgi:glutaredoxin 3